MVINDIPLSKFSKQIDEFFRNRTFTTVTEKGGGLVDVAYIGSMMTLDPVQIEERNNFIILTGMVAKEKEQ